MKVTIELPNEYTGFKSQMGMVEYMEKCTKTMLFFSERCQALEGPKKPYKPDAKIIKIEK